MYVKIKIINYYLCPPVLRKNLIMKKRPPANNAHNQYAWKIATTKPSACPAISLINEATGSTAAVVDALGVMSKVCAFACAPTKRPPNTTPKLVIYGIDFLKTPLIFLIIYTMFNNKGLEQA